MQQQNGLQVAQDRETPVQTGRSPAFTWRYAYARSADTRTAGDPGQDYVTFRYDDTTFAFALCDGVSQSFFGDLSARLLGDALLEWIWKDLPATTDTQNIKNTLTNKLKSLTTHASELVKRHPLPRDIPKMLREVLEQKRALGSESTFVCGRIDLPSPGSPHGRAVMAWMGDSRLRVWGPDGERSTELGDTFHTEQRWSTHKGTVEGGPHVFVGTVQRGGSHDLSSIAVYSDGLAELDKIQPPSDGALNELISNSGKLAVSDDVSFLEVRLVSTIKPDDIAAPTDLAAPSDEEPTLAAPVFSATQQENGRIKAKWQHVKGASRYGIEVENGINQSHEWSSQDGSWTSPPLKPGSYRLRVRGYSGEEPGEWSKVATFVFPDTPGAPAPQRTVVTQPITARVVAPLASQKTGKVTTIAQEIEPKPSPGPQPPQAQIVAKKRKSTPWALILIPMILIAGLLVWGVLTLFGGQDETRVKAQTTATAQTQQATVQAQQAMSVQTQAAQAQMLGGQTATAQSIQAASVEAATSQVQAQIQSTAIAQATSEANAALVEGTPLAKLTSAISASNAKDLDRLPILKGHTAGISAIAFSPDGLMLASASADKTARIWRMSDGALLRTLNQNGAVNSVAFSPDGQTLAMAIEGNTVQLWNVAGQKPLRVLTSTLALTSITFSPDGQTLAAAADKTVQLWRMPDGAPLRILSGHTNVVRGIAFSPDGQTLASASADNTARLWHVADGTLVRTLTEHKAAVNSVAFSADSQTLASASDDKTVKLWHVADGTLVRTLEEHPDAAISVAFAPKETIIATGCKDRIVRIWDTLNGSLARPELGPIGMVKSVTFSPNGRMLAAGSDDGTVQLWGVNDNSVTSEGTAQANEGATATAEAARIEGAFATAHAKDTATAVATTAATAQPSPATPTADAGATKAARQVATAEARATQSALQAEATASVKVVQPSPTVKVQPSATPTPTKVRTPTSSKPTATTRVITIATQTFGTPITLPSLPGISTATSSTP